jgi:hypothetical protein
VLTLRGKCNSPGQMWRGSTSRTSVTTGSVRSTCVTSMLFQFLLPVIFFHSLVGASWKTFLQDFQEIVSGKYSFCTDRQHRSL